jgi:hypothetical protein
MSKNTPHIKNFTLQFFSNILAHPPNRHPLHGFTKKKKKALRMESPINVETDSVANGITNLVLKLTACE